MASRVGLSRGERKAQTRAGIVAAATRLFAAAGIEATSLDRIAQEVGLTKGAVYSTFEGKDDLVEAVREESRLELGIDPLLREDLTLRQRLRLMALDYLQIRKKVTRELVFIDLEMYLYAQRHPSVRKKELVELRGVMQEGAEKLEMVAKKRGEPLPMPAEDFINALAALVSGIAKWQVRDPDSISDESIVQLFEAIAGSG